MQSDVGRSPQHADMAVEILNETRAALVGIVTVTFLVLFLLAGGPPMLARMSAALATDLQSTHTLRVISAVRVEVSRYYSSIALINLRLWFGGWFWGVAGIVMAVPALVSLKLVAQHSRLGRPLTEFLRRLSNGVACYPRAARNQRTASSMACCAGRQR